MKRPNLILGLIATISLSIMLSVYSYNNNSTTPEDFEIVTAKIIKITPVNSSDIVFYDDYAASYTINNVLGHELNLDSLNVKVLNKTVTLHLEKLFLDTPNIVSQLAVDDKIIFSDCYSSTTKLED